MTSKAWDAITDPFPNVNGAASLKFWNGWVIYNGCNYVSILELKFIHDSKMGSRII